MSGGETPCKNFGMWRPASSCLQLVGIRRATTRGRRRKDETINVAFMRTDMTQPRRDSDSAVVCRHGTRFHVLWTLATGLILFACHRGVADSTAQPSPTGRTRIANLHAFARLYGVVRWFHPSDAAAATDWDRFAIEGVRRIMDVRDARSRRAALGELFAPIAPTVRIAGSGEEFDREPVVPPASTSELELVSWEHNGFGDSTLVSAYASKRRHREYAAAVPGELFASLSQTVDATPFRGGRIRLRGQARAANRGRGQLWLRVDRGEGRGFVDNMQAHPVVGAAWQRAEIVGTVDADATSIVFGVLKGGNGTAWYDDLELAVQSPDGSWKPIEIRDGGFESPDILASWSTATNRGRKTSLEGWVAAPDPVNPGSGSTSLRMERLTKLSTEELFDDAPGPGETVDISLGDGLRARVPLALYSNNGHTLGDDGVGRGASDGPATSTSGGLDVVIGIADVVVVWNVLQHFWPYWDVVSVDWNAELDVALADAADDRTVSDHVATIQRLLVTAPDDHARTTCGTDRESESTPFTVEVIEDRIVVTATAAAELAPGDVVTSIDHRPAMAHLHADEALISGSQQWRRHQASVRFGKGRTGSRVTLGVLRNGKPLEVTVVRNTTPAVFSHTPIDRLDDGVYYVDLSRASKAEIGAIWDSLARAPGVVFDMRQRPTANTEVLSHLLTRPDDSNAWLAVPRVIRPDHTPRSISSWQTEGWKLPALEPHIAGRVAFLSGPDVASYGESLMSFVEHYHLGAIVGTTTAGTNGNVAEITAPSGCTTRFSGLRVTKHDGSRHHLVGIQPTIAASRTIAGVAAGRDEVLERGLTYVRSAQ